MSNKHTASLFKVCGKQSQFPEESLPEIAIVGKSNVGKSTLINTLLGRSATGKNGLARTSQTPGKTRTINWYLIDEAFYLVDLPGYGYAKTSKAEQAAWAGTIEAYFRRSTALKRVLLLVDVRHEPGENDLVMLDYLNAYQIPVTIIATKADKVTRNRLPGHLRMLCEALEVSKEEIIPFSSLNKSGLKEVWEILNTEGSPDGPSNLGEQADSSLHDS